jgi:hypothetical protein
MMLAGPVETVSLEAVEAFFWVEWNNRHDVGSARSAHGDRGRSD